MLRSILSAVVPVALVATLASGAAGCHRHRAAEAPPPPPAQPVPPPPPPPCDLIGIWQANQTLPGATQQIEIIPGDRPGVFNVRARNGANLGVATLGTTTGGVVDTQLTDPLYRCSVGPGCNAMTCAFTGGAAPATFTRIQ